MSRAATLPACLPEVSLTFLVVSLPDGGRRARYGKLRFPSCAPFHPPGPPLPWALSSPLSESARLLGKAGVSVPVGSPSRTSHGLCALTTRAFSENLVSGGRASRSYQRETRLSPLGQGARKTEVQRNMKAEKVLARSSPASLVPFFSTLDNSLLSPAQCDAFNKITSHIVT